MSAKNLGGTGILYTDRRNFYLKPEVTKELWTTVAPFTTIASNQNMVTGLPDPIFKLFEHRSPWRSQYMIVQDGTESTGVVNGVFTVPNDNVGILVNVDNFTSITGLAATPDSSYIGLAFEVWDSTKTTRRGTCIITTSDGTNFTFKNLASGAANAFATAVGDIFNCIGRFSGEGQVSPEAWHDDLKVVWGSTGIFRTPVEVTGTLYQAALRGYSKELSRLRDEKSKEHKIQKERAFLSCNSTIGTNLAQNESWGATESWRTDADGKVVRTPMGIISAIETYGNTSGDYQNIFNITKSSYKYTDFLSDMEKVFQYYPEDGYKYAICGPGAISYWSAMDTNVVNKSGFQIKMSPSETDPLGFNTKTLETPHGQLKLVVAPVMRDFRNNQMVVIAQENVMLAQYRPMRYSTNIKTDNAFDGVKDEYFSDEGIGMNLIESHSLFTIK